MRVLHQSKYFTLWQYDQKRCFQLETDHKSVQMSCCQLLALRNNVNAIDLEAHFDDEENRSGIEILLLCNREHVLILDTYQVIDLKEFMAETFAILEFAPFAALAL